MQRRKIKGRQPDGQPAPPKARRGAPALGALGAAVLRASPSDGVKPQFTDPKEQRPSVPFPIGLKACNSWGPRSLAGALLTELMNGVGGLRGSRPGVSCVSVLSPHCPPPTPTLHLGQAGGSVAAHPESAQGARSGPGVTRVSTQRRAGERGRSPAASDSDSDGDTRWGASGGGGPRAGGSR